MHILHGPGHGSLAVVFGVQIGSKSPKLATQVWLVM